MNTSASVELHCSGNGIKLLLQWLDTPLVPEHIRGANIRGNRQLRVSCHYHIYKSTT